MFRSQLLIVLLCCVPFAACLNCYVCDISDSTSVCAETMECPGNQQCLTITVEEIRDTGITSLYQRKCGYPEQCGRKEHKVTPGVTYNTTKTCCTTDLCNHAVPIGALRWGGVVLCLLPILSALLV